MEKGGLLCGVGKGGWGEEQLEGVLQVGEEYAGFVGLAEGDLQGGEELGHFFIDF